MTRQPPRIDDAPGLVLVPRKRGLWSVVWRSQEPGFEPKNRFLCAIGFGWCQAVRERWKICDDEGNRSARTEAWRSAAQNALKNSRAYVEDGSEYHAALITGPDFFCALFAKG